MEDKKETIKTSVTKQKALDKETQRMIDSINAPVDGMRKGVSKRDLITSLSKEDWLRIDQQKQADSLLVKNKTAYKLFLMNDQLILEKESLVVNIRESISSIKQFHRLKKRNAVDIMSGITTQRDMEGEQLSIEDLEISQIKINTDLHKQLVLIRSYASKLFVYVDQRKLGEGVIMNEEEYEEYIRWVEGHLLSTGLKLLSD